MERVVTGDMPALGELFERHKQPLFGYLYRILTDQSQAEDLLLEVFLRVHDRRQTYKVGAKFSTWLYTIAHNMATDHHRHQRRTTICQVELTHDTEAFTEDLTAKDLERDGLTAAVRQAIAQLPEEQRIIIVLREYQGLSYKEIATVTNITEETARVRAHRARQALRDTLQSFLQDSSCIS
ncbi:MAG: RNA polymerase sigma factor [Armatimonadota bacterium]